MILSQISWLDCIAFLIFLLPQLLINVGLFRTAFWVLGALPSLAIATPYQFVRERFFTPKPQQSPFVQQATPFQDFVIRCVRYAFANMPAYIGRVFFSKGVSLPFLYFRMFRHGFFRSPLPWREIKTEKMRGIWITHDETRQPDVVVLYCHGGGFSMGSSYFYMEFLVAWVALLKEQGFENPALFALEYTLVPDAVYPTQVQQLFAAYEYVLSIVEDSSRICLGGDSAGGTLVLSMLLYIADHPAYRNKIPGLVTMISPWVTIVSPKNRNTPSDYLSTDTLHLYGRQYAGSKVPVDDPMVSPGNCKDIAHWRRASPTNGWYFAFGSEEVLGPEMRNLIDLLKKAGQRVVVNEAQGSIHAWPVASLYLGATAEERLHGLKDIVGAIGSTIGS